MSKPSSDRTHALSQRASRIAEALGASGRTTLGLLPASIGHRTECLAVELGALLASGRSETVGVVLGDPLALERASASFARASLRESIELLAPPALPPVGDMFSALSPLLSAARGRHGFVLLDVSAASGRDEQLALSRLVEAVCIIVQPGLTTETDLLSLQRDVGEESSLGVLLAGP